MKKNLTRMLAVAMIAVSSVSFTGCFGSFQLTRNLWQWNADISDSKFVNELVFLGLCVLPVYEVFGLGDLLIFNTVEFWSGSNPIAMKAGEVEENQVTYAGNSYHVTKSQNKMVIASEKMDASSEFRYFPEEEAWYLMDGDTKVALMKNDKKMFKAVQAMN